MLKNLLYIFTENPLFFLNNLTSLNLVYPISTFNLPGLYAEYRYNGLQMIAETELIVYYLDGSILVNGSIELSDVDSRTYKIEFPETLIPVAEITIVLNLQSQLGTSKSLTIVVNSHGISTFLNFLQKNIKTFYVLFMNFNFLFV